MPQKRPTTSYIEHRFRPEFRVHSGGLVNSETPENLRSDQSPDLLNVRPLAFGRWGMRNGIARLGDSTSGSGEILSLWNFKRVGSETLIRTYLAKIQYLNGSSVWTDVPGLGSITVTSGGTFGFANDKTYVYMGNALDDFMYWDGSGSITQTSANDVPRGNIYSFYLKRLCIAGNTTNPATVYYSKTGNAIDFRFSSPRVADDGGSILVGDGGDAITALKSLITPDGNSTLLVFKKSTRIYGITFATDGTPSVKELKKDTGAINDRTTIEFENDVMYVDEGNNVQTLGYRENIQNDLQKEQASYDLEGETPDLTFDDGCAYYFKRKKFAIFCAKSFGSDINDTCFVYFTRYKSWWKWNGINANQFVEYNSRLTWASSSDRNVYYLTDNYDDLDAPIRSYRDSKDIDLADLDAAPMGVGFRYKQTRYWFVEGYVSPNCKLTFKIIMDGDEDNAIIAELDGTDGAVSEGAFSVFGRKIFGREAFGGAALSPTAFPLQQFLLRISVDTYSFRKARLRIEQNDSEAVGAPYVITKHCPWIAILEDDKFPDDNKI